MTPRRLCRWALILVSAAFVLSAWLYCLATIRTTNQVATPEAQGTVSGVITFFRDFGGVVLVAELVALAVTAVAMIRVERRDGPPTSTS